MGTLDGKNAVVTGAGSGIGRSIAVRFAREGASVALLGRRKEMLEETLRAMPKGDHLVIPTDVTAAVQVAHAKDLIRDRWGTLHVLVNNAGVSVAAHPIASELAEWMLPIDTMFMGAVHCTRAFVPLMPVGSRIVMVTSIHRERVEKGASAYATAKGALTQYARALAVELADQGILVNAVAPGFVDTPMSVKAGGKNELAGEWFRTNYVEGHHLPLRRAGKPDEIAGAVLFLAGPDATYITGETITVDGGLTITF